VIADIIHSLEFRVVQRGLLLDCFIRSDPYVGGIKSVHNLSHELRETDAGLVVVVDEYRAAKGIVAVDDFMEEVES
jgi:Mg2+/Co2+ transporter CorC